PIGLCTRFDRADCMYSSNGRARYRLLSPLLAVSILIVACARDHKVGNGSSIFRVALLTPGPVSDAGWNAAAYQGLELIKSKLGAETALVQTTSPADFEDSMRDFASRG